MKAVKKVASLVLMLMLVLSLSLAGCGKKDEASPSSGGEEVKASDLKPYTVKLIYIGAEQKDEKVVEEAINNSQRENQRYS